MAYEISNECTKCGTCEPVCPSEAISAGDDKYVLGGLGPCGDFLEPIGMVKPDELKAAFAEQAAASVKLSPKHWHKPV